MSRKRSARSPWRARRLISVRIATLVQIQREAADRAWRVRRAAKVLLGAGRQRPHLNRVRAERTSRAVEVVNLEIQRGGGFPRVAQISRDEDCFAGALEMAVDHLDRLRAPK